jgi:precorrin-8X/cobalt-precorrin-8 methylmutase
VCGDKNRPTILFRLCDQTGAGCDSDKLRGARATAKVGGLIVTTSGDEMNNRTCEFDAYLIVDWSANNRPKRGKDSIWYCLLERVDGRMEMRVENPETRALAIRQISAHLTELAGRSRSTLVGFDFAYGYPQGFGSTLQLSSNATWRAIWDLLSSRVHDDERNRNNRFEVAARINQEASGTTYPFWGCPAAATRACLSTTRGLPPRTLNLPEFRITDQRQRGPHSVWKLCYPGAVGSQVLVGIPYLKKVRDHPDLASISRVWPFETSFQLSQRYRRNWTILHAEVYPSLYPYDQQPGECKDRTQVCGLAVRLASEDEHGTLHDLFLTPIGLSEDEIAHIVTDEGWILGMR